MEPTSLLTASRLNTLALNPPQLFDASKVGGDGIYFEYESYHLQQDITRFQETDKNFTYAWDFALSEPIMRAPEILSHTLFLRILAEGAITWTKILSRVRLLENDSILKSFIQAIALILDDPQLDKPSFEEGVEFRALILKYETETKEQLVEKSKSVIKDWSNETYLYKFGHLLDFAEANTILNSINLETPTPAECRLLMFLMIKLDLDFWRDKQAQIATLITTVSQDKGRDYANMDIVVLNLSLTSAYLRDKIDLSRLVEALNKANPIALRATLSLLYAVYETIPAALVLEQIRIAKHPRDLNVIARMIHSNYKNWNADEFKSVMNLAVMKDHLLLQLSHEIMESFFGDDRYLCFKENDTAKIYALLVDHEMKMIGKNIGDSFEELRDFAVTLRFLEVYGEAHSQIFQIYGQFVDMNLATHAAYQMWSLDYSDVKERAVSEAFSRRFERHLSTQEFVLFKMRSLSIRNNFLENLLFESTESAVMAVMRETEFGYKWHQDNIEKVKALFLRPEFFSTQARLAYRATGLSIYIMCFNENPEMNKWIADFLVSVINDSDASFKNESMKRPELTTCVITAIRSTDWTIGDINGASNVSKCLVELLRVVAESPEVLTKSTVDQLCDWIDSILTCKTGIQKDWDETVKLLIEIRTKLGSTPIPVVNGKGRRALGKPVDPFKMRLVLLKDHIKKVMNSEELMHALIEQRKREALEDLEKKKVEYVSIFDLPVSRAKLNKLESKKFDDPVLEKYNTVKKTLLRDRLEASKKAFSSIEEIYETQKNSVDKGVELFFKEKNNTTLTKKLTQWKKGLLTPLKQKFEKLNEEADKQIESDAAALASATKTRDFELRRKALLTKETTELDLDSYLEIIEAQKKALANLKQKRIEKLAVAETKEEFEKIERTFETKAKEIQTALDRRLGRDAQSRMPAEPHESVAKQLKTRDRENEALRKALDRAESKVAELQQAKPKVIEIVDPRLPQEQLITLLEAIVAKSDNAKKMLKMIRKEGGFLKNVSDLKLFLEHADFLRADVHGGSHRTMKGPNDTPTTIANHGNESKPEEIDQVIETVLASLKKTLGV